MTTPREPIQSTLVARVLQRCHDRRYGIAVAALVLFVLVEVALHLPPSSLPRLSLDKVLHAICYGGLTAAALLVLSVFSGWRNVWRRPQGLLMAVTTLFGLSVLGYVDEVTQPLTGRRFEWSDLAADVAGILMVGMLFTLLARWITRDLPQTLSAK